MRTLAIPNAAEPWSLTSLREKLIKIGAKIVSHGRYVTFQMAEIAVSRQTFADILSLIARLLVPPAPARRKLRSPGKRREERYASAEAKRHGSAPCYCQPPAANCLLSTSARFTVAQTGQRDASCYETFRNLAHVGLYLS
jgi:hypothetical protein